MTIIVIVNGSSKLLKILSAKKPVKNAPSAIPKILTLKTHNPITVPLIFVDVKFWIVENTAP